MVKFNHNEITKANPPVDSKPVLVQMRERLLEILKQLDDIKEELSKL